MPDQPLEQHTERFTWAFVVRVIVKASLLFAVLNLAFAGLYPLDEIGGISVHRGLLTPRQRLPYGENPPQSFNLSLNNLPAMFATHQINRSKAADEFRVLLIGDSATWGILLRPQETLSGQLNAAELTTSQGDRLVFYNLGHPIMSLTKDLLILDYALDYEPDMIVWLVTMESFWRAGQMEPPLVQHQGDRLRPLVDRYNLALDTSALVEPNIWERTIVGQRRALADWLRLQFYGMMYFATDIDQFYPQPFPTLQRDYAADYSWHQYRVPQILDGRDLAFDVLAAGIDRAGEVPVLIVNEPMFISRGKNSRIRYNLFYPRWAYDLYRTYLLAVSQLYDWPFFDFWNAIPPAEFTDSAVHMTPQGTHQFSQIVGTVIQEEIENN